METYAERFRASKNNRQARELAQNLRALSRIQKGVVWLFEPMATVSDPEFTTVVDNLAGGNDAEQKVAEVLRRLAMVFKEGEDA